MAKQLAFIRKIYKEKRETFSEATAASDYLIYCVIKIGTTQLYAGRVISQSFCTMFFVPTSLCRKQTVQSPS